MFSSSGNTPVVNDGLQICLSGDLIQLRTDFTTIDFSSSHPAELSRKVKMILSISSSVTGSRYNIFTISCFRQSLGILEDWGMTLAKNSPTCTKYSLNLFEISNPSSITWPLCLNLLLRRVYLRLFITYFVIFQDLLDYFYVLQVNHGNTYVELNATHVEIYFCIFCTE